MSDVKKEKLLLWTGVSPCEFYEKKKNRKQDYRDSPIEYFGNQSPKEITIVLSKQQKGNYGDQLSEDKSHFVFFDEFAKITNREKTEPFTTRDRQVVDFISEAIKVFGFNVTSESSFFVSGYAETFHELFLENQFKCYATLEFFHNDDGDILDYEECEQLKGNQ